MDTKREGRENAGNQLRCRGCRILISGVREVLDIDKRGLCFKREKRMII